MAIKYYDAFPTITMGGKKLDYSGDPIPLADFQEATRRPPVVQFTMEMTAPPAELAELHRRMEEKVRDFTKPREVMSVDMSKFNMRNVEVYVESRPDPKGRPPVPDWLDSPFPRKWPRVVEIVASAIVDNRDTGEPLRILIRREVPIPLDLDPRPMLQALLRQTLVNMLTHELDECLYVNGSQLRDPHPEERRPPAIPWPKDPEAHLRNTLQPWSSEGCTCGATCGPACRCP